MAFNKLRGSQIQPGILSNQHFSSKETDRLAEAKVAIDWATRGDEILSKKLVVDYVQVSGLNIPAGSNAVDILSISAAPATADNEQGAVVQASKNKVILRDALTGDPVLDVDNNEVYGRLTHDGTKYVMSFFSHDGLAENAYTFAAVGDVDYQFPQRFTFLDVAENFASNEKFVDGASDVSARLDLQQIAKDVFGATYGYDHDGVANRTTTLVQDLATETTGVVSGEKAKDIIDEVVNARNGGASLDTRLDGIDTSVSDNASDILALQTEVANAHESTAKSADGGVTPKVFATLDARFEELETDLATEVQNRTDAIQAVRDDLASNLAGKGASLIGIEDVGAVFTATTVEGALDELEGRLAQVELTGGQEVTAARSSVLTGDHASLDDRLEAGETRFEAVKTEVETARGTSLTLTAELARIEGLVSTEAQDRADADQAIRDDLASTVAGKGASLVGVEDAGANFVGTTVEAVLAELQTNIGNEATARSNADTALGNRVTALEGTEHEHFAEDKQILAADPLINTSRYDLQTGTFVAGNKSLTVYLNGMIQMAGVHYTEVTNASSEGIAVSFSPDLLLEGDVIQLRWVK